MKNTIGSNLTVTLFGESHGEAIGCVIDGISPGLEVDKGYISEMLEKRKGISSISTSRREADKVRILSGVFCGKTTGTPICLMIENNDTSSKDYTAMKNLARPGHADFTALCKYHGYQDYRGGGHFSGRLTAPLVAAGAIALKALKSKGIHIGTHISRCGEIEDRAFSDFERDIALLDELDMPVLDSEKREQMLTYIESICQEGDSIGGVLSCCITGMPEGVGEPWFDTVESMLAHSLFAIPAVKGVEFGSGFEFGKMRGSQANDVFTVENTRIVTATNHNGGINGGITNGMPICFNVAIKPTPSIYKSQNTVDMLEKENAVLDIKGRHDPAIIHRARVVVDSVAALVLCDLLITRFGTDYFGCD